MEKIVTRHHLVVSYCNHSPSEKRGYLSHTLQSLKGGHIADYIGFRDV